MYRPPLPSVKIAKGEGGEGGLHTGYYEGVSASANNTQPPRSA